VKLPYTGAGRTEGKFEGRSRERPPESKKLGKWKRRQSLDNAIKMQKRGKLRQSVAPAQPRSKISEKKSKDTKRNRPKNGKTYKLGEKGT